MEDASGYAGAGSGSGEIGSGQIVPSAPPSAPADLDSVLSFAIVLTGTLSEFDRDAAVVHLLAAISHPDIAAEDIDLKVSSASVLVNGTIRSNNGDAMVVVHDALTAMLDTPSQVLACFGLPLERIEAQPSLSHVHRPPSSPPLASPPPASQLALSPPSAPSNGTP